MPVDEQIAIIRRMFDDVAVGVWVAAVPGGELLYANRHFAEIVGMQARSDVVAGQYALPYGICDRQGRPYPEERMPFALALERGGPVTVDDIVIHRHDGRRVFIRAQAQPWGEGDAPEMVMIVFVDITQQVETDETRLDLHEWVERYDLAARGRSEGLWEWRPHDGQLFLSPRARELLGLGPDAWSGVVDASWIHPEDFERLRDAMERHSDEGADPIDLELRIRRADGRYRWFRVTGHAELVRADPRHRFAGYLSDVHAEREERGLRDRFVRQVLSAEEAERRRISRELHDGTGQALTSLLVGLRGLVEASIPPEVRDRVEGLRGLCARTLDEVGRLAQGLHPRTLDDFGFAIALERHIEELVGRHGLDVDLTLVGFEHDARLPPPLEVALYRLLQEALNNVVKHAGASRVSVIVEREPHRLRAIVEDDGCGFDADAPHGDRLGLYGMRERVHLLAGQMVVESSAGSGTLVRVELPINGVGRRP